MKQYKCKKSFCVDKYDDDGFLIENSSVVIDKGKIYELDDGNHIYRNRRTESCRLQEAISQSEKLLEPLHLSHTILPVGKFQSK